MAITANYGWTYPDEGINPFYTPFEAFVTACEAKIYALETGGSGAGYVLLAGRAGGQTINGGTGSGDDLTLHSTAHATKDKIYLGSDYYDEVNRNFYIAKVQTGFIKAISTQAWESPEFNMADADPWLLNSWPSRTGKGPLLALQDHVVATQAQGSATFYVSAFVEAGSNQWHNTAIIQMYDRSNMSYPAGVGPVALYIRAQAIGTWTNPAYPFGIWVNVSDNGTLGGGGFTGQEINTSNYIANNTVDWDVPTGTLRKSALQLVDIVTQNPGSIPYYSDVGIGIWGYRYGIGIKLFRTYGIAINNSYSAGVGTGLLINGSIATGIDLSSGTFATVGINATGKSIWAGSLITPVNANDSTIRAGGLEIQQIVANNGMITDNLYYNGGGLGYTYRANGYGNMIQFANGSIHFYTAPNNVGGAGAAATPIERLRITPTGNIGVGGDPGTNKFQVLGGNSVFIADSGYYPIGVQYSSSTGRICFGATNSATPDGAIFNAAGASIAIFENGRGMTVYGGFGCNGAASQTSYASGGALNAYGAGANGFDTGANASALHALVVKLRACLVANGMMS